MGRIGKKLSKSERAERDKMVVSDYLSGMNRTELVCKHGYHKNTISLILKQGGIRQRGGGNLGSKQDKIDKLLEEALKAPEQPKSGKVIANGHIYKDMTYQIGGW